MISILVISLLIDRSIDNGLNMDGNDGYLV